MFRFFRVAVGLLLISALVWYVWRHPQELEQLGQLSLALLLGVFCLRLAAYTCFFVSTWWLVRLDAPGIGLGEYFAVSASGLALNAMAPPGSGYAVKTLYLKRRHGLRHREFLAVNVVIGLLALSAAGLLGLLALGVLQVEQGGVDRWLLALAVASFIGPLVVLALIDRVMRLPFARLRHIDSTQFDNLLRHQRRLATTAFMQLARSGFSFVAFGLLFRAISGEPLLIGGVLDALSALLRLVNLIPGNLGLYEWAVGGLADALGASLASGLLAAALFRFIGLASVLLPALLGQAVLKNRGMGGGNGNDPES